MKYRFVFLVLLALACIPSSLKAQANFIIPVNSTAGPAIGGATVTLTCLSGGCGVSVYTATTDSNGNAQFVNVIAGRYTVTISGVRIVTYSYTLDVPPRASGSTNTISNGIATLGTSLIASGACATAVTVTATGVATTDNIMADFNADPTGVVGYQPSANGILTIIKYPTLNNVNFKVCNNTGAGITPGAITLNWRVVR
jgi:hypothetical protein